MFVKPVDGRMVRWPRTMTPLREAGEDVPADVYWLRALRDGDVEEVEPPAKPEMARTAVGGAAVPAEAEPLAMREMRTLAAAAGPGPVEQEAHQ